MDNNKPEKRSFGAALAERLGRILACIWGALSRNVWLKLLSFLLAVLMWNYVISTNTTITRSKTVSGLTGYITGQTTLSANRLALRYDPSEELSNISVTVDAPQAYYSRVTAENVQVTLDLSSVRTAGTKEVPLRAVSSYGRVSSISPETISLTFEAQDSRSVPINAELTGDLQDDYWYSIGGKNPEYLTITGAGSVVRSISSATAFMDVSGHYGPYTQALPFVLTDISGKLIGQELLNLSSSSVSVSAEIYPQKELPVSTDLGNVITGQPADGYVVQSVTMQPETVTVAAEAELLEGLTELMIEPVNVDGASQSFTTRAGIDSLNDFKNVSTKQVYVNVVISEASINGRVDEDKVRVIMAGKGEGLSVEYNTMGVYVTGPRSVVEELEEVGVLLSLDLTGLDEGTYEIEPAFEEERYPSVQFKPEQERMTVVLTRVGDEE